MRRSKEAESLERNNTCIGGGWIGGGGGVGEISWKWVCWGRGGLGDRLELGVLGAGRVSG